MKTFTKNLALVVGVVLIVVALLGFGWFSFHSWSGGFVKDALVKQGFVNIQVTRPWIQNPFECALDKKGARAVFDWTATKGGQKFKGVGCSGGWMPTAIKLK
jgi:hypothetical protein